MWDRQLPRSLSLILTTHGGARAGTAAPWLVIPDRAHCEHPQPEIPATKHGQRGKQPEEVPHPACSTEHHGHDKARHRGSGETSTRNCRSFDAITLELVDAATSTRVGEAYRPDSKVPAPAHGTCPRGGSVSEIPGRRRSSLSLLSISPSMISSRCWRLSHPTAWVACRKGRAGSFMVEACSSRMCGSDQHELRRGGFHRWRADRATDLVGLGIQWRRTHATTPTNWSRTPWNRGAATPDPAVSNGPELGEAADTAGPQNSDTRRRCRHTLRRLLGGPDVSVKWLVRAEVEAGRGESGEEEKEEMGHGKKKSAQWLVCPISFIFIFLFLISFTNLKLQIQIFKSCLNFSFPNISNKILMWR
jgi:hypothetical protein